MSIYTITKRSEKIKFGDHTKTKQPNWWSDRLQILTIYDIVVII